MAFNRILAHDPANFWSEMDRAFERALRSVGRPAGQPTPGGYPALNIWEKGDGYLVEAEVPGLSLEDLEILVRGAELSIRGERRAPEEQVAFHRRERGVGRFQRTITLPAEVDSEKVEARLQDGVLTLTLPKSQAALPRKIEVQVR